MDVYLTTVLCIIVLYNLASIGWEYLIHRNLTKLEEKQSNMQIGYRQMSERIGFLEDIVFELNRKIKSTQQNKSTVRKKQ